MQKLKLSSSRMAGTKMPCTITVITVVFTVLERAYRHHNSYKDRLEIMTTFRTTTIKTSETLV